MKKDCILSMLLLVAVMASSCSRSGGPAPVPPVPPPGPASLPILTTVAVSNISDSGATSGGNITSDGGSVITARGVMWDTSAAFLAPKQVLSGTGTGSFSANITGLSPKATKFVRAFATNAVGTGYGNTLQFTTTYTPGANPVTPGVYTVSTFAGSGASGSVDGPAGTASFLYPVGVTVDPSGVVYVLASNATGTAGSLRRIGTDNMVTTIGTNIGIGGNDVVLDTAGNIYDLATRVIYKITPAGVVSTFAGSGAFGDADGTGVAASFRNPVCMDIDGSGTLYVADANHIRKVSPEGKVTTLPVSLGLIVAIAVDKSQNLYVADGTQIKKIDTLGNVTFIAGSGGFADGKGSAAGFGLIGELRVGADGNIYATEQNRNTIRMITPAGLVTTIAGTGNVGAQDGDAAIATFSGPLGMAIDKDGRIFVADALNNKIRKIVHK